MIFFPEKKEGNETLSVLSYEANIMRLSKPAKDILRIVQSSIPGEHRFEVLKKIFANQITPTFKKDYIELLKCVLFQKMQDCYNISKPMY